MNFDPVPEFDDDPHWHHPKTQPMPIWPLAVGFCLWMVALVLIGFLIMERRP